jgi:hypothetical protein
MLSLESIIEAIMDITETVAIDGVTGFVPVLAVARLLMMRGAVKDTGRGAPTSRQLGYLRSQATRFPDRLELRIRRDGAYLKLL